MRNGYCGFVEGFEVHWAQEIADMTQSLQSRLHVDGLGFDREFRPMYSRSKLEM